MDDNVPISLPDELVPISWPGNYSLFPLYRKYTPPDGHCLFHAVLDAFYWDYQRSNNKMAIVKKYRKELSNRLGRRVNPNEPATYYDLLNFGNNKKASELLEEHSLQYMKRELESNSYIGYGYIEFIADAIDKDIYILDATTKGLYSFLTEEKYLMVKGRESIILYYVGNNHFELVGLLNGRELTTCFRPNHELITFLRSQLR